MISNSFAPKPKLCINLCRTVKTAMTIVMYACNSVIVPFAEIRLTTLALFHMKIFSYKFGRCGDSVAFPVTGL